MTIGIIVKTKHFALNFFVKQNRTTSIILILKVASKKGRLIRVLFWQLQVGMITQTILQSNQGNNQFKEHTTIIRIKPNLDNFSHKLNIRKVDGKELKREIMSLN